MAVEVGTISFILLVVLILLFKHSTIHCWFSRSATKHTKKNYSRCERFSTLRCKWRSMHYSMQIKFAKPCTIEGGEKRILLSWNAWDGSEAAVAILESRNITRMHVKRKKFLEQPPQKSSSSSSWRPPFTQKVHKDVRNEEVPLINSPTLSWFFSLIYSSV